MNPDQGASHGRLEPMADVAMNADQGVVWLIEHEAQKIWKQFPEHLAVAVEQAHILTHKNTYTHT